MIEKLFWIKEDEQSLPVDAKLDSELDLWLGHLAKHWMGSKELGDGDEAVLLSWLGWLLCDV